MSNLRNALNDPSFTLTNNCMLQVYGASIEIHRLADLCYFAGFRDIEIVRNPNRDSMKAFRVNLSDRVDGKPFDMDISDFISSEKD